ncbi:MAG TPA: LytTR family DNA-binding domain-containing protein [Gemmatimonadaceae bacterium]|nr:LytTR family DNA-binding domain-containing protein [Gemmatimonadaceae bacterium]
MKRIRVGIVDDEPLARERIVSMLSAHENFEVVAQCSDGVKAVAEIRKQNLDVVFLDVRMPELDGFQVLEALGVGPLPVIVFVTAFDDYALRAFDASALDYLLKPFDRPRFEKTLARVEAQLGSGESRKMSAELREFLAGLAASPRPAYPERFPVKSSGEIYFVRAQDIDWIDSAGNYVALHAAGRKHLIRDTIKSVESKLDPRKFVRVHRSAIINLDRLRKLQPYFHGEYVVTLSDGTTLTSSRAYSERLRALLG